MYNFIRAGFWFLLLVLSSFKLPAQQYTYRLLSGSTITPANGATLTGPPEALSGTFTLTADPDNSNSSISAFFVSAIDFSSASYSLTLGATPQYISQSEDNAFYFASNTYVSGAVSGSYSLLPVGGGSFTGDVSGDKGPTTILTGELGLAPFGGGYYVAHAQFNAEEVPEPPAFLLMSSLGAVLFHRWRRAVIKI